ncbi:T9SS type A sorting domain-containing protein [Bacteroidota bacterium]
MSSIIYAQRNPPASPQHEIFIWSEDLNSSYDTMYVWFTAQSMVWGNKSSSGRFPITTDFDFTYAAYDGDDTKIKIPLGDTSGWYGVHHVISNYGNRIGYGLYRVDMGFEPGSSSVYFYLDWRDCEYSDEYVENDSWLKYKVENTYITTYFDGDGSDFNDWTDTIYDGDHPVIKIWESKPKTQGHQDVQVTKYFELITTLSIDENDHPNIEWQPYHDTTITGYYLYRHVYGSSPDKIFVTDTIYVDDEFTYGFPIYDHVDYWVTAKISSTEESGSGDTVSTHGEYTPNKEAAKNENISANKTTLFNLDENYPNPFNPTTNISYSIISKSNVKLRVFNSLGQEIEILVSEIQGEGYYTVPFDAGNLPSGIYFYQLITDYFTDVKKMVVAK